MKWHILGAGAMGCLWASYLWQHCASGKPGSVALILRNEEELARYDNLGGIALTRGLKTDLQPIPAHSLQELSAPLTHLLLATKAQDVESALASVRHLLTATTCIVLLQNGLKLQKEIAATCHSGNIYCVSTSQGAYLQSPFHVVHAGQGDTWIGQLAPHSHPAILRTLPVTELRIRWDGDIETRLWEKLAVNCAVNALTVIHDCRNGELLTIPAVHQDLLALIQEIQALLQALPEAPALPDLHQRVDTVLHRTALNISSTLQDVRRGRPTEMAHLNGYLCELARKEHLSCPLNQRLLERFARAIRARRPD